MKVVNMYADNGLYEGTSVCYEADTPSNCTEVALPPFPWTLTWPKWNGESWNMIEDHRTRGYIYDPQEAQQGTIFWMPGDTYTSVPRAMAIVGPLPEGAILTRPEPTPEELAEANAQELQRTLDELDRKAIRSLRAKAAGTATPEDEAYLQELEQKANEARTQYVAVMAA